MSGVELPLNYEFIGSSSDQKNCGMVAACGTIFGPSSAAKIKDSAPEQTTQEIAKCPLAAQRSWNLGLSSGQETEMRSALLTFIVVLLGVAIAVLCGAVGVPAEEERQLEERQLEARHRGGHGGQVRCTTASKML